jgi:hypothetical protein
MKFYIYVSDSKVDMLLAQIPHDAQQTLATEFKVDLKIFSASRRSQEEVEENRFTRLEVVTTFIREFGNIGTIDEPDEFIEGSMEMQWGPYSFDKENPPVYFGCSTERTIFGMGGSMKHLVGSTGDSHPHSHSITPVLVRYLEQELQGTNLEAENDQQRRNGIDWSLCAVELATTQMKGPKQPLEFMAKRLLYGNGYSKKKKVLLASPLYVAMLS